MHAHRPAVMSTLTVILPYQHMYTGGQYALIDFTKIVSTAILGNHILACIHILLLVYCLHYLLGALEHKTPCKRSMASKKRTSLLETRLNSSLLFSSFDPDWKISGSRCGREVRKNCHCEKTKSTEKAC